LSDTTWNGNVNNWSQDKAGTIAALSTPGQGTDVIFQWNAPTSAAVSTTLEQSFKINSLTFEAATNPANTPASVTIASGIDPSFRLSIAPQVAADGIKITAGGPAAVNITAALRIVSDQTWSVADAASVLSLGPLFGEADVIKSGAGKVTLTAAADLTFNTTVTSDFTINSGTLEILTATALGSTANSNLATITVNTGGAFYYNGAANAAATGVANKLTLTGGTLSAGGNAGNNYYTGTVNVSAGSFINMRGSNSAVLTATQGNVVLSGVVSGAGSLTVDSINTLSAGNQISGTLYFQSENSGWSGGINLIRGTVQTQTVTGLGTGNITASAGRIQFVTAGGTTYNLGQNITVDGPGGILELSADASGTPVSDMTVNLSGIITIGSAANANNALRISQASDNFSIINITNSIVLGNNASLSYQGSSVRPLIISAVISDGGIGRSLAINDELGAWAVTSQTIRLLGANTFGGDISLKEGTLEFNTVTNIGGAASSLGQGSAINIIGTSILRFMGDTSQSTNRALTSTASFTLDASGTSGAIITYAGAITQGVDNSLNLTGTGEGVISGGISQPTGTSVADLNVNSGIWTLRDNTVTIADDVIVTGASTVLNLNTTGILLASNPAGTSSGLYARTGAIINLNADDVNGVANSGGLDFIIIGDSGGPQTAILNTNTFNISTPRLDVGQRAVGLTGQIDGTGTVTVAGGDINLYDGTVNASLASTGLNAFEKFGLGTVTLKGDNSGLASTGNSILYEGTLVLDYTVSNTTKLRTASVLEMLGGNLILTGNASAATSQTVASTTLDGSSSTDNSGASTITLNPGAGQQMVLNLGAVARGNTNRDGTIRFILPSGTQSATNGFTTSTLNGTQGLLGTSAFATVDDGTGIWFATNATNLAGGNIVALISTIKNDVSTWAVADHVTDDTTGFTGTIQGLNINTLRFNAVAGSDLVIAPDGILSIASGGILVTGNVGGTPSIQGGTLASGVTELIITQDSAQTFTIGSDIRINHAVTKSGTGTLLLTGNNVYTDETEILQGTLQVSGGNAIGDNSIVSLNAYQDTTLQLLDDETIGRLSGGQRATNSDNGTVAVGTHTLTINEISSTTYAGFFTGTGKIVKQGAGNLNLTNLSTGFTGIFTVAEGTLQLSGSGQINASIIRVNKGGTLLIDNNGTTRSGTRILDTTTITLNSADGTFSGQTIVRGLAIRTDQGATTSETIGSLNFASGANYLSGETTNSTGTGLSAITADDFIRLNNSTVNVRGRSLGLTTGSRNQFLIGTSANQTAFIATMVGGGGLAGSTSISIVPWAVGETTSGALAAGNMGNSLVTYVSGAGFRPLDLTTEYKTLALAGTTDNARESLSADLTGLGGKTINSLVLNNAATPALNVTGSGAGQSLGVTSGALLFTVTGAVTNTAYTTTLGGFANGITVGSTNEYVISVINPNSSNSLTTGSTTLGSSIVTVASTTGLQAGMPVFGAGIALGATVLSVTDATHFVMSLPSILTASSQTYQYATLENLTASISSPLTSTADITKSGRGTLILSGVNTAGGGTMKTTLNEGILQITSLGNIGGTTGSLVFAGGTLRLGAGFSDDISLRTISFLQGGGTIDTNGNDLVLAQSVGSGVGGLTKIGAGNLTLNAAATYTGATTIAGGTLTLGADNATGVGGDLNIGAGATLDMVIYNITAGLVSFYGDSPMILGSGSITSSVGFYFGNTGDINVATVLAGSGGLLKTQTNTLFLSGFSTFTGPVEVQAGTLSFESISSIGGGASSLGSATTAQNGVIHMGLTTTATSLIYTGGGSSSDRTIGMQGTTGAVTLDASGSGALVLGGVHFETAGNKTLTLKGLSDPLLANTLGSLNEYNLGVLTLVKSDTNTWVISSTSSYSGATSINDGTLRFTADQNLAGALNFGTANSITTAGTLDLSTASATFAGNLLVQTNTALETNQILIGAGESLTIGGTVTLGGTATNSTTLFSASGAGTFNVINTTGTGLTFLVGNNGSTNTTTADFSALATMNVSLNTTSGILQVSSSTGTNSTGFAALILAQNTTITASALTVGGGGAYNGNAGQVNSLKLGTGTNVINVDTLNIGTGSRDLGSITFLNSNGTLAVRAADGIAAAAFNMGAGTSGTAALLPVGNRNTFDVSGHTVDLLFGTVSIGTQNARTGPMDNLFAFDTGTLTTGNLTMGSKTAAGNSSNVMNLGGGVVTIGSGTGTAATLASNTNTGAVSSTINVSGGTVTIGSGSGQSLILGNSNTNATGSTTTALNVSGGSVTLATTGTTAVTMASANAGSATATISITAGTLTVQGDILRGTGSGTRNATITLNGGTLDMTGKSIGASTNAITFNAQSGTLTNLAQLNGGGAFTKTTTGTLYMDGVNSYTGTTTVTAGTLQFLRETALYNNTSSSWTADNIVVGSAATAAFNVGGTGQFTASDVDVIKSLGSPTGGFQSGSFLGLDTTNAATGSFTYDGVIADTNSGANSVGLKKLGTNTLVLTQTSTYSGTTTVAAGTLQVGDGASGALAGSGTVTVSTSATLSGSASIAGATVITSGAVLAPGVGATSTSNQTLTFTAAGTAVNVNDGGQIQLSLTSSSQVDAGFDQTGDALTYLNTHGGATGTAYTTIWNQSGNYDSIRLTNGTFTLGTTAGGTLKLLNNSATLGAGSIFKLLDWTTVGTLNSLAGTGSFTATSLDLSGISLGSGLAWDTSAFTTYGVIVVVPEPSRTLLLLLGLSAFTLRRRKVT
jgi:fibronectin-binding autotransporter adhesin